MISVLKKYIDEYDIEKALIVGRNIINKTPDDKAAIELFLNFLFELANSLTVIDERREFLEQARIIISFVEENADLDQDFVGFMLSYSNKALEIEKKINKAEDVKIEKIVSDIEISNNKALLKIHELCDKLKYVSTQEEFDQCMKEFIEIDRTIEKDYLTKIDKQQYDDLSKMCSETISIKMQELEHKQNIEFNKRAVQAYFETYKEFSDKESEYKANLDSLVTFLKDKFFGYDTSRLFPETVIYYQYVYSRIFDKLSDEGKLVITQASIEAN